MVSLEGFCTDHLRGACHTDARTRHKHSTDMSIYTIVPDAVVEPADADDVSRLLQFCSQQRVPVTARAGASNTGGSAIGEGVVLLPIVQPTAAADVRLQDHGDELLAEAPAGLRHDRLQRMLNERGFHLPSDPSSGPLSYIGANVATRASGAHALRHGAIDRYLSSLVVLLADGTRVDTADPQTIPTRIRTGLSTIADRLGADGDALARLGAGQQRKTASGYNLTALLAATGPDLTALFAGSVGTLGIIETVRLRCPTAPTDQSLLVLSFDSEADACDAVSEVRRSDPAACEILNRYCVQLLADQGVTFADSAGSMLVVEYSGESPGAAAESAHSAADRLYGNTSARTAIAISDPPQQAAFWKVRKRMMLQLRNRSDGRSALSVVNDIGVPVDSLAAFLEALTPTFSSRAIPLPIYGHAADGNLHLRPLFDTHDPALADVVRAVADETYELVLSFGGTITAEHGMGRLRAPYLRREWGDSLYETMREINGLFDPGGILNHDAMFYEGELMRYFGSAQ